MSEPDLPFDRRALRFDATVREEFGFLATQGFSELDGATPTFVAFSNGNVIVTVYHGRRSFEVGVEIAQVTASRGFPLGALIELQDGERSASFRKFVARTPETVRRGLADAAALLAEFGAAALRGDSQVFAELLEQRHQKGRDLHLDGLASQLRPEAASAFRERRFADVVTLLGQIRSLLTPAELKKLDYAEAILKRRSSS